MQDEFKRTAEMLAARDGIESYINNLEKLKAEGAISVEQYTALKAEYGERLNQADGEIALLKNELQNLVITKKAEIENAKFELSKLETKCKVGELSLEAYQGSENSIKQTISGLEQYINYVNRYIQARSSSELKKLFSESTGTKVGQEAPISSTAVKLTASQPPKPKKKLVWIISGIGGGVLALAAFVVLFLFLTGGGQVEIPVEISGVNNLGALHLELTYDSQSLSAVSVKNGGAAKDAILEYNVNDPGKVVIGLVSVPGITKNGDIITVVFNVQKGATSTSLNLENIDAYDADTLANIPANDTVGTFSAKDKSFVPPTLVFASK